MSFFPISAYLPKSAISVWTLFENFFENFLRGIDSALRVRTIPHGFGVVGLKKVDPPGGTFLRITIVAAAIVNFRHKCLISALNFPYPNVREPYYGKMEETVPRI